MSTLLILPDTINVNTNTNDINVVLLICSTIVVVVGIVAFAFYKWQETKYCYQYIINEQKYRHVLKESKGVSDNNTNKPNEKPVNIFLAFCEDRKDIRENKTFIDYCVAKYKTLKDKQLESKEDN